MASVVERIGSLGWGERFDVVRYSATWARRERESTPGKIVRHLGAVVRLVHTIFTSRCAIVHIHTCSGFSFYRSLLDVLVARLLMRRIVLHIHGASFDEFFEGSSRTGRFVIRKGLAVADAVVALSESWSKKIRGMSPRASLVVIENAVDLPDANGEENGACTRTSGSQPCRFLLLARMDTWKGIDDLFEACVRMRDESTPFQLTMAGPPGSAGDAHSLSERIEALGLRDRVCYVGEVRGAAKEELLRASDAYVQPSHNEGMPIAVLEALSYGLPVVATDVGALSEVITSGREGLIVPRRSPAQLSHAMGHIAMYSEDRLSMGRAARDLAERRFSEIRLKDDLVKLYDSLIQRKGFKKGAFEFEPSSAVSAP